MFRQPKPVCCLNIFPKIPLSLLLFFSFSVHETSLPHKNEMWNNKIECLRSLFLYIHNDHLRILFLDSPHWNRKRMVELEENRGEKKKIHGLKQAIQMNSINIITQLFVSTAHYLANQQIMSLFSTLCSTFGGL